MAEETTIEQDFTEVFKKHLPEALAGVLKQRFEELEEKELKYESLKTTHENVLKEWKTLKDMGYEKDALEQKAKTLDEKEAQLNVEREKFENSKQVFELSVKLDAEQQKTQFTKEVALGLVRNTTYRSHVFENKQVMAKDQYGNEFPQSLNTIVDETKNEE